MKRKSIYAAYGSNLHKYQMKKRCPNSYIIGYGYIDNYGLEFRGVANIKPIRGQKVPIVLWSISEIDEAALDRYEGVASGLYRKEIIEVQMELGKKGSINRYKRKSALIYIMNVNGSRPIAPPSPFYYETIREGYLHHGFDFTPLVAAAISSGAIFVENEGATNASATRE